MTAMYGALTNRLTQMARWQSESTGSTGQSEDINDLAEQMLELGGQ